MSKRRWLEALRRVRVEKSGALPDHQGFGFAAPKRVGKTLNSMPACPQVVCLSEATKDLGSFCQNGDLTTLNSFYYNALLLSVSGFKHRLRFALSAIASPPSTARPATRSAVTSTSTIAAVPIRALTVAPRIKPTSTSRHSAWRPNHGRRSTYRGGNSVQSA
jgi:hypothetical protein